MISLAHRNHHCVYGYWRGGLVWVLSNCVWSFFVSTFMNFIFCYFNKTWCHINCPLTLYSEGYRLLLLYDTRTSSLNTVSYWWYAGLISEGRENEWGWKLMGESQIFSSRLFFVYTAADRKTSNASPYPTVGVTGASFHRLSPRDKIFWRSVSAKTGTTGYSFILASANRLFAFLKCFVLLAGEPHYPQFPTARQIRAKGWWRQKHAVLPNTSAFTNFVLMGKFSCFLGVNSVTLTHCRRLYRRTLF